mmetsp:Transcript_54002/g.109869  ORF Transcript_54002/g.109869 Transcript_54002/m.109869 type:complete len:290 (-) Transcript_54002:241-1110(-)
MSKYGDFLKSAKDLLSKTFKYENQVTVETKTNDGVTLKSQGVLGKDKFRASVEAAFNHNNLEFKDIKVDTNAKVSGKMNLKSVADGLDVTFAAEDGLVSANSCAAKFGLAYKNADFGTFNTAVNVIDGPVVTADTLINYQGFLVGGEVELDTGVRAGTGLNWNKYNVGLGYDGGDFRVGVTSSKKFGAFTGAYYQKVNSDTKVAAKADYTVQSGDKKAAGNAVTVAVGGSYALSADTTVNGMFNSKGQVSGSYTQAFNKSVTLTAAAQVNAMDLGADDHKFGLNLKFKA